MKKILFALVAFAIVQFSNGQKKELTLEDAILYGNGALIPERITGLQWIPGQDAVTYYESSSKAKRLLRQGVNGKIDTLLRLEEINPVNEEYPITSFRGARWIDESTLFLRGRNAAYLYDIKTNKAVLAYGVKDRTSSNDVHYKTGQLAFTKENNLFLVKGEDVIAVTNHTDKNIVAGQAIARSEYGITKGTFWSPTGSMLAFYEKDETDVADYPLLDINTTPGSLRSIKYPMAGQGSERANVGIYHLLTKQVVYLKSTKEKYDYFTNLAWDPTESFVYVAELNRATNHMKLNKYNALTGDFVATLFEEKNDKWVEPETPAYFPGNKKDRFIWMSERDGFMNLYLYSTNGKLIRQLTENKWVAKSIIGSDKKGNYVFFTGTGSNPTETHIYKVNLSNGNQTLLTQGVGTHSAQLSSSGKYFLDDMSGVLVPHNITICNTKDGYQKHAILSAKNPLDEFEVSKPELFTIKSADGSTDLHCRMIKPANFDETKKYPVLVYVYGGPHAQMVTNRFLGGAPLWMYYQANRDFIIFTVDNRGSGNRGWAFESGIHRQLGELEMADQLAGVEYLKSLAFVDENKMAVHGWSYGGFMTTSLMLRQPGTFKVGVAGGPVTNWEYYEVMYGERYMDTPAENAEGYEKNKLSNYVNNLEGDLLLIHGTVDPTVVMQHSFSLVKAFVDAGIQVDFFPYPMHEHNVRGKDRIHLMRKVLTYIEDKIGE